HQHPVRGHRPLDRAPHALRIGPKHAALVETARRLERQLFASHLARELDHALGQRVAVGDDDNPHHVLDQSPYARWRKSIGWTDGRSVALVICHRQVSLSHATVVAPDEPICSNSGRPTLIAISYFSSF